MIPTNPYGHVNEDLSAVANEARRKRRRRHLMSVLIVTGFVVGIILLLSLTAGSFRTPKFRVRSATFGTFDVANSTQLRPASFDIAMNTEVGIRNRNFRRFRYRSTTVDFYYRERKVGEGMVWDDRVKGRDTRKFIVPVILSSSSNVTELQNDLNGGVLPLRSRSRLTGKFKILIFMRKYKHVNMDCSMDLLIPTRELTNISCR